MPVLTFDQIQSLWVQNGGNPAWAPLAAAIAVAESGGNTQSLNTNASTGDYSVGLWQINYFGNLLPSRTAAYGSPSSLQASPDAQAKAAVALSGNGANWGPWQGDPAWKAWQAHGAPATPTKAALTGWGVSLGGAGGPSTGPTGAAADASASGTTPGTGCTAKGKIFGVAGISFSYCQGKALVSGLLIGVGGVTFLTGTLITIAWGLGHTRGGRAVQSAAKATPLGRTSRGTQRATAKVAPSVASAPAYTPPADTGGDKYDEGFWAGVEAGQSVTSTAKNRRQGTKESARMGVETGRDTEVSQGTGTAMRPRGGTSSDRSGWMPF